VQYLSLLLLEILRKKSDLYF